MRAPKLRSRVGKIQAKNTQALAKVGLHKGIRQHYIGKPKNTDNRMRAAAHLKAMRKS